MRYKTAVSIILAVTVFLPANGVFADLAAHYKLDEAAGATATDSSGSGRNGTLAVEAGEQLANGLIWQPLGGRDGGAILFDGDGPSGENPQPRIQIPTAGMSPAAGSVALWINLTDPAPVNDDSRSGNIYFFGMHNGSQDRVQLYTYSSARLKYSIGNYSYSGTAGYQFIRGGWTHIAIKWDNGSYSIYIDGELNTGGSYNAAYFDILPATADIGNTGETSKNASMHGLIDDVHTYSHALAADEILGLAGGPGSPDPANGATNVDTGSTLSWTAGTGATSRDVYFGTDNPPPFAANTTATSYQPPDGLIPNTVYYWQINESSPQKTVTGYVWSFTAVDVPPKALNPSPANGQNLVSANPVLSWAMDPIVKSYDIYFGTVDPPPFLTNTTSSSFELSTLSFRLIYYWRVDQINSAGTATGDVWSFTTLFDPPAASFPYPQDGANNVDNTTKLYWQTDPSVEKYAVYFGKTSPPPLAEDNHTENIYIPGTLDHNTVYYWRIDQINASGRVAGPVWSFFTTALPSPAKAFGPEPLYAASGVGTAPILRWQAGDDSDSFDVYFGTTDPPPFAGNQQTKTFVPAGRAYGWDELLEFVNNWLCSSACGTSDINSDGRTDLADFALMAENWLSPSAGQLAVNTAYYWRIDTVNQTGKTIGSIWRFTTITGQASQPSPENLEINVSPAVTLSWTAGYGATSHDVYCGKINPPPFVTNTAGTTYGPMALEEETVYFWRVNEYSSSGIAAGAVWSFKTGMDPKPSGWYKLDETAGDIARDSSGNNYNAAISGGVVWDPNNGILEGMAVFPKSGLGNLYVPTNTLSMSNSTILLWVQLTDSSMTASGYRFILGHTGERIQLYMNNGTTQLNVGLGNKHELALNVATLTVKKWYHLGLSWNGTGYAVYVDGEKKAFGTFSGFIDGFDANIDFGNNGDVDLDKGLYGLIDDIRVFNQTLSDERIAQLAGINAGQARNPRPANWATVVDPALRLSWIAGDGAVSHNVYLGTAYPPPFVKNQTATSYQPPVLAYNTTYHWKIDEKDSSGSIVPGNIWQFVTASTNPPSKASNPSPADGEEYIATKNISLCWDAGSEMKTQGIYFGTSNPPAKYCDTKDLFLDMANLLPFATYYWRVDQTNSYGTTAGDLWSFTTGAWNYPDMVLWLKLNEGSGRTAFDSSGCGNDAVFNPLGRTGGDPTWVQGVPILTAGSALSFDGDDHIYVEDSPEIEFSRESFTVAFWMKAPHPIADAATEDRVICNGSDGGPTDPGSGKRYQFFYNGRYNQFRFTIDDDTNPTLGKSEARAAAESFYTDEWVHVAGVRDTANSALWLYCNGVSLSSVTDRSGNIASPEGLNIGGGPVPKGDLSRYGYHGSLDDIRFYNDAMPAAEIGRIAGGLRRAFYPEPANKAYMAGLTPILGWTSGENAVSHNVYFGTDAFSIEDGTDMFRLNTMQNSFYPGKLLDDTYYFWRVDEIEPNGVVVKGNVWVFNTGGSQGIKLLTECSEQAFRRALDFIANVGAGTITFNCTDSFIDTSDRIYFFGNNLLIDGEDKNNTFRYTGPDICNQVEGQDCLIQFQGDNNMIRNFTLWKYPDGIHVTSGHNNIVEGIIFPIICEDAVTNGGGGFEAFGTIIRGCYMKDSVDKAIMLDNGGSCTIEHCEFHNTCQSVRGIGGDQALYTVRNCYFHGDSAIGDTGHGPRYTINGPGNDPNFDGYSTIFENNIYTGDTKALLINQETIYGCNINLFFQNNLILGGFLRLRSDGLADLGGGSVPIWNGLDPKDPNAGYVTMHSAGFSYINMIEISMPGTKAENNEWVSHPPVTIIDVDPMAEPNTVGRYAPLGPQCPPYCYRDWTVDELVPEFLKRNP